MAEQNNTDQSMNANNPISSGVAPGPGEHLMDPSMQAALASGTQDAFAGRADTNGPTAYGRSEVGRGGRDSAAWQDAYGNRQGRNDGGLLQGAQDQIRRAPAAYLIGAIATGFLVQRVLKTRSVAAQRATWPFTTTQWDASRTGGYATNPALESERKYGLETAYAPDTGNGAGTSSSYGEGARNTAARLADKVRQASGDARARLQSTTADAKSRLNDAAEMTRNRYYQTKDRVVTMQEEQPLLIAALGVAIGAGLGAYLPATRRESEMLGGTRDKLMDKTKEVAKTQLETLKSSAQRFADITKQEAQRMKDELADAARQTSATDDSATNQSGLRRDTAGGTTAGGTSVSGTSASGTVRGPGLH